MRRHGLLVADRTRERNTTMKYREVTVCSACKAEACWQGTLMCEDARNAGTTTVRVPTREGSRP